MAKMLVLRWTPITTNSGIWFDSNLVILNGTSGVHIEMKGNGNDVTAFQSMTGNKFVTCFQDYFGDIWDKIIPHPGIGQVMKFRVNKLPDYACIRGGYRRRWRCRSRKSEYTNECLLGFRGRTIQGYRFGILTGSSTFSN